MKTTNYVVTVHWLVGTRSYIMSSLEESLEFVCNLKKEFPTLRITFKRERRESEYWLRIILGTAQQDT